MFRSATTVGTTMHLFDNISGDCTLLSALRIIRGSDLFNQVRRDIPIFQMLTGPEPFLLSRIPDFDKKYNDVYQTIGKGFDSLAQYDHSAGRYSLGMMIAVLEIFGFSVNARGTDTVMIEADGKHVQREFKYQTKNMTGPIVHVVSAVGTRSINDEYETILNEKHKLKGIIGGTLITGDGKDLFSPFPTEDIPTLMNDLSEEDRNIVNDLLGDDLRCVQHVCAVHTGDVLCNHTETFVPDTSRFINYSNDTFKTIDKQTLLQRVAKAVFVYQT